MRFIVKADQMTESQQTLQVLETRRVLFLTPPPLLQVILIKPKIMPEFVNDRRADLFAQFLFILAHLHQGDSK